MTVIYLILLLVWLHFLGDFILQNDKMAVNKSKSNKWLYTHVTCYSLPFLVLGFKYAFANFVLHAATDFVSSRATSYLWQKGERHWFFVVIGLDQAIHFTCLILTLPLVSFWW